MTAFVDRHGATVAYDYAEVTIVGTGPYGLRKMACTIPFDDDNDPLLAMLLQRCEQVLHMADATNLGGIS